MKIGGASWNKAVYWRLIFAAAFTLNVLPAFAQSLPGTINCKYHRQITDYFPDSPDQGTQKIDSVHVCSYSYDGHREAELVLAPEKSPTGVCIVRSIQFYLPPEDRKNLGQRTPPADWEHSHPHDWWNPLTDMQVGAGECPPPGDANYIRSIGVPPGTFIELTRFWKSLIAAPEKFEENFALVLGEKADPTVIRLRTLLTDPALLARIHLQQVSLENQTDERFRGVPIFLLTFPDLNDRTEYYSLCLDWVDGKLKIIGVVLEFH